jgi:hypothetical protein
MPHWTESVTQVFVDPARLQYCGMSDGRDYEVRSHDGAANRGRRRGITGARAAKDGGGVAFGNRSASVRGNDGETEPEESDE